MKKKPFQWIDEDRMKWKEQIDLTINIFIYDNDVKMS